VSQPAPVEVPADEFDILVELEKLSKSVKIDLGDPGVDSIEFTGRDPLQESGRERWQLSPLSRWPLSPHKFIICVLE
jgi:hypothetical protein